MVCCCAPKEGGEDSIAASNKNPMIPSSERKCRDVLCCLLFLLYWVGMILVGIVGLKRGKPQALIHPKDFAGRVCGIDDDVKNASFAFYPRLAEDIYYATTSKIPLTKMKFYSVCVDTCPHAAEKVNVVTDNITQSWTSALDTRSLLYRCLPSGEENKQVLTRECIDPVGAEPTCTVGKHLLGQCAEVCKAINETSIQWSTAQVDPDPLTPQLQTTAAIFGRLFGDVKKSALTILLFGGLGSFVLGVFWIFFLGYFAKVIIWVTCFLVIIMLLLLSLYCSIEGGTINDPNVLSFIKKYATIKDVTDETKRKQFAVLSYISWVVTGVIFLLILAMRKRIRIAIAIVKEASKSLRSLPFLLLWPIIPTVAVIGIAIYWIILAAFLLTTDSFSFSDLAQMAPNSINISQYANLSDTNSTSVGLGPVSVSVSTQNILFLYHLFGFLWTNQLFQAISICTIAGSVAEYYWAAPDQFGQRAISPFPVLASLGRTLRYHIGSLCFGSLIIAIVQFIRIILQYIDQNTKTLQESNTIVKIVLKIVQCCLWCFEKCLKFISANAYIIIAMKGSSFCSASMQAFVLILTNVARVATLNTITFFMLLLVKITIVVAICLIVFTVLIPSSPLSSIYVSLQGHVDPVTSPIAPVIITGIISYFVTSILLNLYDMTINTILICFCEDAKMNDQKASPYMSKELQDIMGGKISPTSPVKVTPREEQKLEQDKK